jgi:hypothetical protein
MKTPEFAQLAHRLQYLMNPVERILVLQGMVKIGTFAQLKAELPYLMNRSERQVIIKEMSMKGTFSQLSSELQYLMNPVERVLVVQGMANVGTFEEFEALLPYLLRTNERQIILSRMSGVTITTDGVGSNQSFSKGYDLFIAHATEDKSFVTPLANCLCDNGLSVWYDDFILKAGDSLRREIDRGLAHSKFGLVVLSHYFFNKHYPQKELDGLAAKEKLGVKVIIPIWHNIVRHEIESYSPTLADIVAIDSNLPLDKVVKKIQEAIRIGH